MEYRVEKKYLATDIQIEYLRTRLGGLVKKDPNMKGDSYLIRSLYFDDMTDSCLTENESGTDEREKFRIRTYDNNHEIIKLELKGKKSGFTSKKSTLLSFDEADRLLNRKEVFGTQEALKTKISAEMQYRRLQPVCIVEYERTAYVDPLGNVRITFDRNIAGSSNIKSMWDNDICVMPVLPIGQHVIEIKYDEFLPDYIGEIIREVNLNRVAFSKYYFARMTGMLY